MNMICRRRVVKGLAGLPLAAVWADPTGSRFGEADATAAWERTRAFFAAEPG